MRNHKFQVRYTNLGNYELLVTIALIDVINHYKYIPILWMKLLDRLQALALLVLSVKNFD
jgi:hypothetical protein